MSSDAPSPRKEPRLLDSGYWYVRFGSQRFAQWPKHRPPTDEDFFGWWSDADKADAIRCLTDHPGGET